jgi:hypothetical protein
MPKPKTAVETGAPADTTPATPGKKYQTYMIGVGKTHAASLAALNAKATELGVRASSLVWAGIAYIVANPPPVADLLAAGGKGAVNVGSAAGFWVHPITNKQGRATDIKVFEVSNRSQLASTGTFFRYNRDDVKERNRSHNQAIKAAQYMAKMIGLNTDKIVAEKFSSASLAA